MLVHGGWSRWVGGCSRAGLLAVGAVALVVGCGGRTSALDTGVYGTGMSNVGDDDDDDNIGGVASGGKSSIGSAGKPGTGAAAGTISTGAAPATGGKPGTSTDPSLSVAACQAYCPGYGVECAERLKGQECFSACQNEVNSFGPKCQKLGMNALKCLTPFFKAGRMTCEADVNRALSKCGKIVSSFEKCKEAVSPSMPTPTPTPMPGRVNIDLNTCSSTGTGGPDSCVTSFDCSSGQFNVFCDGDAQSGYSCTCLSPDGSIKSSMFGGLMGDVCRAAANPLCRQ